MEKSQKNWVMWKNVHYVEKVWVMCKKCGLCGESVGYVEKVWVMWKMCG